MSTAIRIRGKRKSRLPAAVAADADAESHPPPKRARLSDRPATLPPPPPPSRRPDLGKKTPPKIRRSRPRLHTLPPELLAAVFGCCVEQVECSALHEHDRSGSTDNGGDHARSAVASTDALPKQQQQQQQRQKQHPPLLLPDPTLPSVSPLIGLRLSGRPVLYKFARTAMCAYATYQTHARHSAPAPAAVPQAAPDGQTAAEDAQPGAAPAGLQPAQVTAPTTAACLPYALPERISDLLYRTFQFKGVSLPILERVYQSVGEVGARILERLQIGSGTSRSLSPSQCPFCRQEPDEKGTTGQGAGMCAECTEAQQELAESLCYPPQTLIPVHRMLNPPGVGEKPAYKDGPTPRPDILHLKLALFPHPSIPRSTAEPAERGSWSPFSEEDALDALQTAIVAEDSESVALLTRFYFPSLSMAKRAIDLAVTTGNPALVKELVRSFSYLTG